MDKVLSQEEIKALFSAMASIGPGYGRRSYKSAVKSKVVRKGSQRRDRTAQNHMRPIRQAHESI